MSAMLKTISCKTVFQEMVEHPAWYGEISGLDAEKLLRGKKTPYLYLLRAGEKSEKSNAENYYVTFLDAEMSVRHQPIVITEQLEGRCFENGGNFGPYLTKTIDDVLHFMLHCEKEQCVPFQL